MRYETSARVSMNIKMSMTMFKTARPSNRLEGNCSRGNFARLSMDGWGRGMDDEEEEAEGLIYIYMR